MPYLGNQPASSAGIATTATGTVLSLSDTANTNSVNVIIDNQKEIRFRETTANGTNYIGVLAPASLGGDFTLTLPAVTDTLVGVTTTDTLTNKTISGGSNTLSNIGNSSLTNALIKFADETSTVTSIPLGGTLKFTGAALVGDTLEITGGTDWQAVVTADGSTTTTAVAGEGYFIDTTSAAHTLTLPTSATLGDTVSIIDVAGTFDSNNLTVARNGHEIQGIAENLTVATERAAFSLVYSGVSEGWLLTQK